MKYNGLVITNHQSGWTKQEPGHISKHDIPMAHNEVLLTYAHEHSENGAHQKSHGLCSHSIAFPLKSEPFWACPMLERTRLRVVIFRVLHQTVEVHAAPSEQLLTSSARPSGIPFCSTAGMDGWATPLKNL